MLISGPIDAILRIRMIALVTEDLSGSHYWDWLTQQLLILVCTALPSCVGRARTEHLDIMVGVMEEVEEWLVVVVRLLSTCYWLLGRMGGVA
jgi:hypothetical protein